jgi:hypothetical protein
MPTKYVILAFTSELPINSNRGMVFSVWSIAVVVSCCCEKLAAKDENSSEIQKKGNVCLWKPLSEEWLRQQQAEKTSVCAIVNCKVCELVKWL